MDCLPELIPKTMKMDLKRLKPWINGLEAYKAGKTIEGLVKLASNENNYGPSPKVVKAIKEWSSKSYKYPYLDREVCEAISGYVGVESENIVVGNGSDELIDFIVKVFKGPFAGFYPSYSEYRLMTEILGEEYVEVRLNSDFGFDVDRFLDEAGEAKACFLCTPNNPTGGVLDRDYVVRILESGRITIVDEAYVEFGGKSIVDLIDEYENLIVLRTFAKAFGLAGLRVGYLIACSEVIDCMDKVKPPFNVGILAQAAVLAALDDVGYMKKCVEKIKRDRKPLYDALNRKFTAYQSEANFVLADVSPRKAADFYEDMVEEGFIVRMFGKFNGFAGEYVRVSVGTTDENNAFISALERV
jgi:histidinol-phosphate aminotransferase